MSLYREYNHNESEKQNRRTILINWDKGKSHLQVVLERVECGN